MGKRVSTRRIKKHRHYTYETAGALMGVRSQTVRAWRKHGLDVLDGSTPHYIVGEVLIDFVERKQAKKSVKLGPDQMFCFVCKGPQKPLGAMVDYVPITDSRGRFVGLCEACESPVQLFVARADLPALGEIFDIVIKGKS